MKVLILRFRDKIHLRLFGWVEQDGKTFIKCEKHGLNEAYVHGWAQHVDCLKCLEERMKEYERK